MTAPEWSADYGDCDGWHPDEEGTGVTVAKIPLAPWEPPWWPSHREWTGRIQLCHACVIHAAELIGTATAEDAEGVRA